MKNKKIIISLFTAGILSSTAFAKAEHQIDSSSYILQNIQQIHKDFLGISVANNSVYQDSLKGLTQEFSGHKQLTLLSLVPFSNPIFNSNGSGAQLAVKSVDFGRNAISEILSQTSKELPGLPLQLISSPNLRGLLTQGLRNLPSQAELLMDSDVINHSDQNKDKGSLFSQSANLLMKLTTNSDEAAIQQIDSIQPQLAGSLPRSATDVVAEDLLGRKVGNIQPQLAVLLPQLTTDASTKGFSELDIEIIQPPLAVSVPQLTTDASTKGFSELDIEIIQPPLAVSVPQLTVNSDTESFSSQREENASQATTIRRAPPVPPSMLLKSDSNLGESKTRTGFSFDAVLQQLKGHMNGSGLRSTNTTLKAKDKGMEISLGQMGKISGKEAQKFADRWAKLREAAEANSKESVAGQGDTKHQKTEATKPKILPLRKAVSEKALRLQKKVTNTVSGSLADQLRQAKLNKAVASKTIVSTPNSSDLKADLIKELTRSKSLNHIDVLAIRHAPQEVTVTIEDLEEKLANTKDRFFRKQIERQINDMKAELLPKVEDKPVVIEATSAPVTLLSLPLDNSGQDKKDEPSTSLPIVVKAPLVQEEAKVIQIGGFSINVTMLNKFAQEDDAEDDNSGDWDEEDSKPLVTEKLIVNQEPVTAEELVIKTVAPKVGKLNIKASTGGDLLAQIRAARAKVEAVETDGAKIQATLDLEKIRADKLKQEARERELEERQAAKAQAVSNKKPEEDLGAVLLGSLTKRRSAMNQVEDEDDEW